MQKKILSFALAIMLIAGMAASAFAAPKEALEAADALYDLGLFLGVGTNADGTPNYDLDREPTRQEAITLLVRLLGKEAEAKAGTWKTPFTDVDDWAKPYVGYAFENGLTNGVSETLFGSKDTVTATQYLTFVLRALGYVSGTDFQWDSAWTLTDKLGLTNGQYGAETVFLRGDAAIVSNGALEISIKGGEKTLLEVIMENLEATPEKPDTEEPDSEKDKEPENEKEDPQNNTDDPDNKNDSKYEFVYDPDALFSSKDLQINFKAPAPWIVDQEGIDFLNATFEQPVFDEVIGVGKVTVQTVCENEEAEAGISIITITAADKDIEVNSAALYEIMSVFAGDDVATLKDHTICGNTYVSAKYEYAESEDTQYLYMSVINGEIVMITVVCSAGVSIDTILSYFV